jgi:hypothetical protein
MSDTPRTDAAPTLVEGSGDWVKKDFARQLERDLIASEQEANNLRIQWESTQQSRDQFKALAAELGARLAKMVESRQMVLDDERDYKSRMP